MWRWFHFNFELKVVDKADESTSGRGRQADETGNAEVAKANEAYEAYEANEANEADANDADEANGPMI